MPLGSLIACNTFRSQRRSFLARLSIGRSLPFAHTDDLHLRDIG
jgi:hypothetical protein